jgi:hypothetical protein
MILTTQDLLNAGMNAFAIMLLVKDFARMKLDGAMPGPIHIPMPIAGGKIIWVTLSDVEPPGAAGTPNTAPPTAS